MVYDKLKGMIADQLGVSEDEVKPESRPEGRPQGGQRVGDDAGDGRGERIQYRS